MRYLENIAYLSYYSSYQRRRRIMMMIDILLMFSSSSWQEWIMNHFGCNSYHSLWRWWCCCSSPIIIHKHHHHHHVSKRFFDLISNFANFAKSNEETVRPSPSKFVLRVISGSMWRFEICWLVHRNWSMCTWWYRRNVWIKVRCLFFSFRRKT